MPRNAPGCLGSEGASPPMMLPAKESMDNSELRARLYESLVSARAHDASKQSIREAHNLQRERRDLAEQTWLRPRLKAVIQHFAESSEVDVQEARPVLVPVRVSTWESDLFRAATLLWSVPVSRGYGRRMRYLVMDESNGKLMGLLALGDPVFNLRSRDAWIGWTVEDRRRRLSSVMDLYICGSVPPYSFLLGSKLVACLATAREVGDAFRAKYTGAKGVISGEEKPAELLVVTTTSALGRSSLYNRLKLRTHPVTEFRRIGFTEGWGHFSVGNDLFRRLREHLMAEDHKYANGHSFGTGPNWRLRTIRAAMKSLGVDDALLKHGIQREVFAAELSETARRQLREGVDGPGARPTAAEIAEAALARWMRPRFEREGLRKWTRADTEGLLPTGTTAGDEVASSRPGQHPHESTKTSLVDVRLATGTSGRSSASSGGASTTRASSTRRTVPSSNR